MSSIFLELHLEVHLDQVTKAFMSKFSHDNALSPLLRRHGCCRPGDLNLICLKESVLDCRLARLSVSSRLDRASNECFPIICHIEHHCAIGRVFHFKPEHHILKRYFMSCIIAGVTK